MLGRTDLDEPWNVETRTRSQGVRAGRDRTGPKMGIITLGSHRRGDAEIGVVRTNAPDLGTGGEELARRHVEQVGIEPGSLHPGTRRGSGPGREGGPDLGRSGDVDDPVVQGRCRRTRSPRIGRDKGSRDTQRGQTVIHLGRLGKVCIRGPNLHGTGDEESSDTGTPLGCTVSMRCNEGTAGDAGEGLGKTIPSNLDVARDEHVPTGRLGGLAVGFEAVGAHVGTTDLEVAGDVEIPVNHGREAGAGPRAEQVDPAIGGIVPIGIHPRQIRDVDHPVAAHVQAGLHALRLEDPDVTLEEDVLQRHRTGNGGDIQEARGLRRVGGGAPGQVHTATVGARSRSRRSSRKRLAGQGLANGRARPVERLRASAAAKGTGLAPVRKPTTPNGRPSGLGEEKGEMATPTRHGRVGGTGATDVEDLIRRGLGGTGRVTMGLSSGTVEARAHRPRAVEADDIRNLAGLGSRQRTMRSSLSGVGVNRVGGKDPDGRRPGKRHDPAGETWIKGDTVRRPDHEEGLDPGAQGMNGNTTVVTRRKVDQASNEAKTEPVGTIKLPNTVRCVLKATEGRRKVPAVGEGRGEKVGGSGRNRRVAAMAASVRPIGLTDGRMVRKGRSTIRVEQWNEGPRPSLFPPGDGRLTTTDLGSPPSKVKATLKRGVACFEEILDTGMQRLEDGSGGLGLGIGRELPLPRRRKRKEGGEKAEGENGLENVHG